MPSLLYCSTLTSIHDCWRNHSFEYTDFASKMLSLFNTLFGFVIVFLPMSKSLLISWMQSPSLVILSHTFRGNKTFNISLKVISLVTCKAQPVICVYYTCVFGLCVSMWQLCRVCIDIVIQHNLNITSIRIVYSKIHLKIQYPL